MNYAIKGRTSKLETAHKNLDKEEVYTCPICGYRVYLRCGQKGRCYFAHARTPDGFFRRCRATDRDILRKLVDQVNAESDRKKQLDLNLDLVNSESARVEGTEFLQQPANV